VSQDPAPRFVSCPPHVSAGDSMRRIKAKTSRELLRGSTAIGTSRAGAGPSERGGFFGAGSGVVTDEATSECIQMWDGSKGDGAFRVDGESR